MLTFTYAFEMKPVANQQKNKLPMLPLFLNFTFVFSKYLNDSHCQTNTGSKY